MFNLREEAGDNAGYELRIGYDHRRNQFYVRGYIVFMEPRFDVKEYERDGATLWFASQDDALKHITEYKYRNTNQQVIDFEAEEI